MQIDPVKLQEDRAKLESIAGQRTSNLTQAPDLALEVAAGQHALDN
jgi:hypothetical protein